MIEGTSQSQCSTARSLAGAFALCALCIASAAQASFHLWRIAELYTDATGNVQFVELREAFGANNESRFNGITLTSSQGGTIRVYTFPSDLPDTFTANKRLLIATQGFANLGIVSPDFVVPAPFLFPNGGALNFAGVDTVVYGPLPTDGVGSIDPNGALGTNSPTNYAGQSGSVGATGGGGTPTPGGQGIPALDMAGLALLILTMLAAGVGALRHLRRR